MTVAGNSFSCVFIIAASLKREEVKRQMADQGIERRLAAILAR
jgi:hypothetical protein